MIIPGHSVGIMGPPGAGKSYLCRTALQHEGGGIILLAPGLTEWDSYAAFADQEGYKIQAFDDGTYLPSIGSRQASGLANAIRFVSQLASANHRSLEEEGALKYPLLVVDAADGIDELARNAGMARAGVTDMPKARSDAGGVVYGTIKSKQAEFWRACRAVRGQGVHLIATCHVIKKDPELGMAEAQQGEVHMPALTGAFRDQWPAIFNVLLHCGVDNNPASPYRWYALWQSDPDRPTKSRYPSPISKQERLPNDWSKLKPLLDRARAQAAAIGAAQTQEEKDG